jgi:UDP-N-acetylglucosamine--N-acetylmuramyl-(pentapeptide) pyrophosphoryl-undecaprenol N-acetylglucosamine transferase
MSERPKKIIIAAGGTGGHLFPAQALAEQLLKENSAMEVLFAGARLSSSPWFDQKKFPFHDIASATPFGMKPLKMLRAFGVLLKGICVALRLFVRERPDLVIGFGSFHVFPLLFAAVLKRVPLILFESNAFPGKVVRFFSPRALFSGIYFPVAKQHLKGKTVDVEIPGESVRGSLPVSRQEAHRLLGFDPSIPTLLVFGGSQGARKINQIVIELLPQFKKADRKIQLIHCTGSEETAAEVSQICQELGLTASVKGFEPRMGVAWSAADLVLCRSGAMTLHELLSSEVPGILIPYPAASEGHQLKNALFLEQVVGGAVHFEERELHSTQLFELLLELTALNSTTRSSMQNAIRCYKARQKKEDFGRLVSTYLNSL